jgi:hypothetical protein
VVVVDAMDYDMEMWISPTADPNVFDVTGCFDPISGSIGPDEPEMGYEMTVDAIMEMLQRYSISKVKEFGPGPHIHPVRHFRRSAGQLLEVQTQAERISRRLPPYNTLPTGQGILTANTNWGFGGGMNWNDLPVYMDNNVNQRDMHVRHVIPYNTMNQLVRRGDQRNPFNRSAFQIGQVMRAERRNNQI